MRTPVPPRLDGPDWLALFAAAVWIAAAAALVVLAVRGAFTL